MTLFDRFLTLLSGEPERAAAPSAKPSGPAGPAEPVPAPQAKADFQQKLREVLARSGTAVGGRVHLLNLGKLAERFGPRWPALADKVDQLIRLSLSRRLSPRDFFSRCEDGVYVIVFDGLSEAEARLKCALIADEIAGKLFGQNAAMSAIDVCSATTRVDGTMDITRFDTADALNALLDNADQYSARDAARPDNPKGGLPPVIEDMVRQVELELTARQPKGAGSAAAPTPDRLATLLDLLRDAERALAATMPRAPAGEVRADPAWTVLPHTPASPAAPGNGAALLAVLRGLIERTEAALTATGAGLVAVPRTEEDLENAELAFLHSPLWHVPRQVINARLCQVAMRAGARLVAGTALLPDTADSRLVALIDRVVALKAVAELDALGQRAGRGTGRGVLVVPVHHSTLAGGPISREFLGLCRSIAPPLRSLLVWELVEPAGSMTALHLPAAVNALKGSGRAVLVRVDIDYPRFEDFLGIGVHAVGTDIVDLDLPEADIIRKLQIFRARADRFGLRCYVHGVRTLSLLAAAVCDGFEYVGGEIIGPDAERLGEIEPFELGDAYAHVYTDPSDVRTKDTRP
ncbi:hypothetical protein [Azospirillum sp.]|uniref:hypothetical protein n=1 Tax=Azospirillum sp. TaxID=34012 RepID=UPI002D4B51B3|nr:hypothetical protein [Azospirillum sp.]HYD65496.1 hypothetical protein [Azospirillum sp.]